MSRFLAQALGKTAVFSITGDVDSQLKQEVEAVAGLRRMGIDATAGHPLIPAAGSYSADDLATLLINDGFKCIAELRPNKASGKNDLNFLYLEDTQHAHARYSKAKGSLSDALQLLIQDLVELGKQRK